MTTKNRKQLIGLTPNYVEFSTQFADSWSTGSTTIMPFTLNRRAHLLVYGGLEARIERIDDDGKGTAMVYSDPWASGWTSFVPFELAGAPHFLAYKAGTGSVVIYKVTADEDGVVSLTSKWSSTWSTGWTSFAPFVHDGQPHYAAYKSGTGSIAIDRIRPNVSPGILGRGLEGVPGAHDRQLVHAVLQQRDRRRGVRLDHPVVTADGVSVGNGRRCSSASPWVCIDVSAAGCTVPS